MSEAREPVVSVNKKRGRKPRDKSYSLSLVAEPAVQEKVEEQEVIILHLPLTDEDLAPFGTFDAERILRDAPVDPAPYSNDLPMGSLLEINSKNIRDSASGSHGFEGSGGSDNAASQRTEFRDEKADKTIFRTLLEYDEQATHPAVYPTETDICCWWCCHQFSNRPVGIPTKYTKDGDFEPYGIFCSYNCACSFLFTEPDLRDKLWGSYSLLNLMYKRGTGATGSDKSAAGTSTTASQDVWRNYGRAPVP